MATITVKRNWFPIRLPGQVGDSIRIMKSDTEPPKNYIWEKDDELLIWHCCQWEYVDDFLENPNYDCCADCDDKKEETIYDLFAELRHNLINQITGYLVNTGNIGSNIEARVTALENKEDKDTIYDDSGVVSRIENLEGKEDKDTIDYPIPIPDIEDVLDD